MRVIAISGKARNGKDTVASMLKDKLEEHGYKVLICHYGDLVKYVCKTFFGWNGEKDKAGRTLLQYVGTDIVRKNNQDFWVDFIVNILTFFDEWDYAIVPDTRFPNEVEKLKACKNFDTEHWRVVRDGYDNQLTEEQKMHPSETALDMYQADLYIKNDGTLKDLSDNLDKILEEELHG